MTRKIVLSKFQIGAKPGHRPQEHLFVLKSVIGFYLQNDTAVYLSMWDVSKFFDRENLRDCLNEVHKNGVKGKLYRLLYNMNKNTRISVQTPVGCTEEADTGETVGQGTLEGAVISSVSLDKGVEDFFLDSEHEPGYAGLQLRPLLFQDDVSRLALDPTSLQAGNDKMEAMGETKLLDFNLSKSCYLPIGKSKNFIGHEEQLRSQPITLCGKSMPCVNEAKLLGDWLSHHGLSQSVATTVKKRKGLAIASIYEIRAVVKDCRSNIIGGLQTGIDLWEAAVVPMLLFNAETWVEVSKGTVEELEQIQKRFLRCLLSVGVGCPTPSLYLETGSMLISNRILQRKLLFLHHLATLPDTSLAKEVYDIQTQLSLPGLVNECQEFLSNHELYSIERYTKSAWKRKIKWLVFEKNKDDLIAMSRKYKKIEFDCETDLSTRHLFLRNFSVNDGRMLFKIRSKMVPLIQMNFPSDRKYADNSWICPGCSVSLDTQNHALVCSAYESIRAQLDLSKDIGLANYFQQIIRLRS